MPKNPNDTKWWLILEDDAQIPVSMTLIDAWFHDWDSVLALLGALKSGRPAELVMNVPGKEPARCKLVHNSQHNGRSNFRNPLGQPDPIVPISEIIR